MTPLPTLTELLELVIEQGIPPTGEERRAVARVLREKSVLRTIATVLTSFRGRSADYLLKLDLTETASMIHAAKAQGIVAGQQQFVEELISYLEDDEEDEKEEEEEESARRDYDTDA